jgi:hypothetical protein
VNRLPRGVGLLDHLLDNHHQPFRDVLTVVLLLLQPLEAFVVGQRDLPSDKRTNRLERNLFHLKRLTRDAEDGNVLGDGLTGDKGGGHRRARLHDVKARLCVLLRVDEAFVFMPPDDKIEKVWQHVFG